MKYIGEQNKIKFKIILKKEIDTAQANIASCRLKLDLSEVDKLKHLRSAVIIKFKKFGVVKDNFDLFWKDQDDDYNIIMDNEDLLNALEEIKEPLYEVIACIQSQEKQGNLVNYYFISENILYFQYQSISLIEMIITDLGGRKSQSNPSNTVVNKGVTEANIENPTCQGESLHPISFQGETMHPVSNLQENPTSSVTKKASSSMSSSGTSYFLEIPFPSSQ